MRKLVLQALLAVALFVPSLFAQETTLDLRVAFSAQGATLHSAEVSQARGKWILPDFGYIDFGEPYAEAFVGAGRIFAESDRFTVIGEAYLAKGFGQKAKGELYLQPWLLVKYRLSPRVDGSAVYFPYVPLSSHATGQHVLDHATLEYEFSPGWKSGAGYAAYKSGGKPWQNKPFFKLSCKRDGWGEAQGWLQSLPGGKFQIQLRHHLTMK